MDIEVLGTALGGSAVSGGMAVWAFKHWIKRVNKTLEAHSKKLEEIQILLAEDKGRDEGESKLIWREINTDKHKIAKLLDGNDKLWHMVHLIGAKLGIGTSRISDAISSELKGEDQ